MEEKKKATVVAVVNQKGGVAKTTTAAAMAAALKLLGYDVLLSDTDPRRDATDTYRAQWKGVATVFDVLLDGYPIMDSVQHMDQGDILPSDKQLEDIEQKLTEIGREYRLKEAIDAIPSGAYDFIVIDTPPQPGVILNCVLTAADICIIPVTPDRYAMRGVEQLDQAIARVRKYSNPSLKIGGFLVTKCDPQLNLTKQLLKELPGAAQAMKTKVFKTLIREAVAAKEAQAKCRSLYDYAPNSNPAADYIEFTKEFLADLNAPQEGGV